MIIFAFHRIKKEFKKRKKRSARIWTGIVSMFLLFVGIAFLTTSSSDFWGKTVTVGSIMIIYGVSEIMRSLFFATTNG